MLTTHRKQNILVKLSAGTRRKQEKIEALRRADPEVWKARKDAQKHGRRAAFLREKNLRAQGKYRLSKAEVLAVEKQLKGGQYLMGGVPWVDAMESRVRSGQNAATEAKALMNEPRKIRYLSVPDDPKRSRIIRSDRPAAMHGEGAFKSMDTKAEKLNKPNLRTRFKRLLRRGGRKLVTKGK